MYSFLMAENRTDFSAITICGADGIIFSDIPRGEQTLLRRVGAGSVRLEIYDNFMKPLTVLWLPLEPRTKARIIVHPDLVQFILLP